MAKSLEQKVQELTDREEIKELTAKYCWHVEHGEGEAVARLFTDDGVLDVVQPDFQAPRGMLKLASGGHGRADHQGAVGDGFGQRRVLPGRGEHVARMNRRAGFAERHVVRIHQAQLGEAEVAHGSRRGADVQRVPRRHQNDPKKRFVHRSSVALPETPGQPSFGA